MSAPTQAEIAEVRKSSLPLPDDVIADQLIRRRLYDLAAQVLPELEMPTLDYEVRSSGTGFWSEVTPQQWIQHRAAGRQVRAIANYDAAHRVVMLFGGDS